MILTKRGAYPWLFMLLNVAMTGYSLSSDTLQQDDPPVPHHTMPQLESGYEPTVARKVNAVLAADQQAVVAARVACRELAADRGFRHTFTTRTTYKSATLLSVHTSGYVFCGGANGSYIERARTFDLRSGNELDLADTLGVQHAELTALAVPRYSGGVACAKELHPRGADFERPVLYLTETGLAVHYLFLHGVSEG